VRYARRPLIAGGWRLVACDRLVDKHQPAAGPAAAGNGRSDRSRTCRLLLALTGRRVAVPRVAPGVPGRTRTVSGRAPAMAGRASGLSSRAPRLAGRSSGVPGRARSVAWRDAVLARCGAVVARRVAAVARRPRSLAGRSSAVAGRRCGVTRCASGVPRSPRPAAGRSAASARGLGGRVVLFALLGVRALLMRRLRLLALRGRAWPDRVAVAQMSWKCISRNSDRHERVLLGVRVVANRHLLGVLGRRSGRTRR
jgi:hypothetical protein